MSANLSVDVRCVMLNFSMVQCWSLDRGVVIGVG